MSATDQAHAGVTPPTGQVAIATGGVVAHAVGIADPCSEPHVSFA